VGCTGATRFAYIIYQDQSLVSAHAVDDAGHFCLAGFGAVGSHPSAVATASLDPDHQHVYVTNSSDATGDWVLR
jgi:hypothetical protein